MRFAEALPLPALRKRPGYHWFVVCTVCIGAFMAAMDASIINVALPLLKKQFHVSMSLVEWVSLAYLLTLAALIVPFGSIADVIGRRWMYTSGFVVFVLGSFLCGIAPTLAMLLSSRVLQAIGAAMLQANSVAIVTSAVPGTSRGRAIGIQASAQGIGLSLGPAIGGALLSWLNWRWMFFVNIPIGLIGTVLGIMVLPKDHQPSTRRHFDVLGAILLIPTLIAMIYVLNMGVKAGWTSPIILIGCAVFVAGLLSLLWVERHVRAPLVDWELLKDAPFSLGCLGGVFSFTVLYAVLFLAPFYIDHVLQLTPIASGLFLTCIPIGMTVWTPVAGAIADKIGGRFPTVAGMVVSALGCVSLAWAAHTRGLMWMVLGLILVGTGIGLFTPPNNSRVMSRAPKSHLGIASGMVNLARSLGMGLGITLGGLSYQVAMRTEGIQASTASIPEMSRSFLLAFLFVGLVSLFTAVLAHRVKDDIRTPSTT